MRGGLLGAGQVRRTPQKRPISNSPRFENGATSEATVLYSSAVVTFGDNVNQTNASDPLSRE
jgi:hypothetical protein